MSQPPYEPHQTQPYPQQPAQQPQYYPAAPDQAVIPYYPPQGYAPVAPVVVSRKEPAVSGLLSWVLPGIGQFYNGQTTAGVLFLVGYLSNWAVMLFIGWLVIPLFFTVPVGLGLVIWSIIDAVVGAQRYNRQRGLP